MSSRLTGSSHDQDLAAAFDKQAEPFERAKVSRDAASLARLVAFAALERGTRLLDAGCGPGLVAEAFLDAGCDVVGVDLSPEMARRARERCARFGERARFENRSVFDLDAPGSFDATVSRNVLHHLESPGKFVARQAELVRSGGVVVALDLSGDPDPEGGAWARAVERARDRTHTRTLTPGEMVDIFAAAGLGDLAAVEEEIWLDFDEWFDRGTPAAPKEETRRLLLSRTSRGFAPRPRADGGVDIRCVRTAVRGVKP
jgi:SAM-dependent methyltransferase